MKKSTKIAALLMIMVMLFALFAIPASANTTRLHETSRTRMGKPAGWVHNHVAWRVCLRTNEIIQSEAWQRSTGVGAMARGVSLHTTQTNRSQHTYRFTSNTSVNISIWGVGFAIGNDVIDFISVRNNGTHVSY